MKGSIKIKKGKRGTEDEEKRRGKKEKNRKRQKIKKRESTKPEKRKVRRKTMAKRHILNICITGSRCRGVYILVPVHEGEEGGGGDTCER